MNYILVFRNYIYCAGIGEQCVSGSIQFKISIQKVYYSLSTNEYWTLIRVHNRKHDSGLGTTLRDISKLYFFAGWKHVDCAGTATKKSTVVTSHGGLSHQSFELFNAKQNIPFIILNETKGARSSDRACVPKICLSLIRHNTCDGVYKTKQNVLTTTSDLLWSLVIHRIHILVPQELSKRICLNYHKRSFGERWEIWTYINKCKTIIKKGTDSLSISLQFSQTQLQMSLG